MSGSEQDRRRAEREAVCRAAEITFGGTTVHCLVMDLSVHGVRVRMAAESSVPDAVTLRFHNGSAFPAHRRWSRGRQVGFEFAGAPTLSGGATQHLAASYEALRERGPKEAVRLLRTVRFFDDVTLCRIAEEAEAACQRLETALAERTQGVDLPPASDAAAHPPR